MLCQDTDGYFYEFVPCWFNSTPVENYEFRWEKTDFIDDADGAKMKNSYYVWSGSLDCGEYEILQVSLIESEMAITDLFKDFEVIPLETTDNSLLIWPDKVMCIDDNYAVFDSRHPAVFLFDD